MACASTGGQGGKMATGNIARRGGGGARSIVLLALLLLAGCGSRFGGPAPVVNGGSPPAPTAGQMVIQPGQTLSGIAQHYHVPMEAIAEANHLSPPYRILAGGTLIIPGAGGGLAGAPEGPVAMAPAAPVAMAPLAAARRTRCRRHLRRRRFAVAGSSPPIGAAVAASSQSPARRPTAPPIAPSRPTIRRRQHPPRL